MCYFAYDVTSKLFYIFYDNHYGIVSNLLFDKRSQTYISQYGLTALSSLIGRHNAFDFILVWGVSLLFIVKNNLTFIAKFDYLSSELFSSIHHHHPLPPPPGVVYNYTALENSDLHKVPPGDEHYNGGDMYVGTPHTNGRGSGFVPLPQTPVSIGK